MSDQQTEPGSKRTSPTAPRKSIALIFLPLIVFSGVALLFWAALQNGDPSRLPSTFIGRPAPEISLPALAGLRDGGKDIPGFSTKDLRTGEPTVVNFFASWCAPCVKEHPLLMALAKRDGARMFGINHKDPPPGGRRFIGRYGNPYTAVGADKRHAGIEWGVYGLPETFVVDGKGIIVFKHVGPLTATVVETGLKPALAKARSMAASSKTN